jgi:hypothetical protein
MEKLKTDKLNPAYQLVKEVRETTDIDEVAEKLSTDEWIAISATKTKGGYLFVLGRTL